MTHMEIEEKVYNGSAPKAGKQDGTSPQTGEATEFAVNGRRLCGEALLILCVLSQPAAHPEPG
jgi:hypothetical protein